MKLLEYLNPFRGTVEQASQTIDKMVLDKDQALELKTQIRMVELEGERLAQTIQHKAMELEAELLKQREETRRAELAIKTSPKVDAFHKLSRTLLSFTSMILNTGVVLAYGLMGIEIDTNVMASLGLGSAAAGTYIFSKGKGAPIR